MCGGNRGIYGIVANLESATYTWFREVLSSTHLRHQLQCPPIAPPFCAMPPSVPAPTWITSTIVLSRPLLKRYPTASTGRRPAPPPARSIRRPSAAGRHWVSRYGRQFRWPLLRFRQRRSAPGNSCRECTRRSLGSERVTACDVASRRRARRYLAQLAPRDSAPARQLRRRICNWSDHGQFHCFSCRSPCRIR